jgi:hypothetical protein
MQQPKKFCRIILEESQCHFAHLMTVNPSQFETNRRRNIMKSTITPVIPTDAMISVMLHATTERNVGYRIMNSSPESSQMEIMTCFWDEGSELAGTELMSMMKMSRHCH